MHCSFASAAALFQARKYILAVLEQAAIRSKERMKAGHEPACLLDFWTQQIIKECQVRLR